MEEEAIDYRMQRIYNKEMRREERRVIIVRCLTLSHIYLALLFSIEIFNEGFIGADTLAWGMAVCSLYMASRLLMIRNKTYTM